MTELTKTLELKLIGSTAHEQRNLRETGDAFQQALRDAFDPWCTTHSEANDGVITYDLSGYAKNAREKYIPQWTATYNADESHEDSSVRCRDSRVFRCARRSREGH